MLDLEQPPVVVDSSPTSGAQNPTETQNDDLQQQQIIEDEIEDEFEGVKLKGKKDLLEEFKNGRLRQADYTRKTQEVAEQRKAIDAERESIHAARVFQQQFVEEIADLRATDKRMALLQQHLQAVHAQDPQQAQALLIELNQLQLHRGQLTGSLTQKQQQQQLMAQRETAKRMQEGLSVLERDIKGWSPELAGKLREFGASQGIPPNVLNNVYDPAFVKILHKAYVADQLAQKQAKSNEPPKPVTRVGGGSASNSRPLSEVTDPAEWRKLRQERKNRNR